MTASKQCKDNNGSHRFQWHDGRVVSAVQREQTRLVGPLKHSQEYPFVAGIDAHVRGGAPETVPGCNIGRGVFCEKFDDGLILAKDGDVERGEGRRMGLAD